MAARAANHKPWEEHGWVGWSMMFRILKVAIPFVWLGFVSAISFMEAPLKFQAPNITTELGLGIGRVVFQAMNKVELGLAIILIAATLVPGFKKSNNWYLLGSIVFILLLQTVWLLPALDARSIQVLSGDPPAPSYLHVVYILSDAVKVILLAVLGTKTAKSLAADSSA